MHDLRNATLAGVGLALSVLPAHAATRGSETCPAVNCSVVYVGTHGDAIYAVQLDTRTGQLSRAEVAGAVERPTSLVVDPKRAVVYAVSETGNDGKSQGSVYSLRIDPTDAKLKPLGKVASGGGGATHVTYDVRSSTVLVANWGGGQVSAAPVAADGSLGALSSTQTNVGTGPLPVQFGPHAHSVAVDPSGRYVVSADLGADRAFIYRFDSRTRILSGTSPAFETLPPGSGPRRLVFAPNGDLAFALTELSAEIFVYRWDSKAGALRPLQRLAIDDAGFTGKKSAAVIAVSQDGRFVYVSNRGDNTVVAYAVNAKSGALTLVQRIDCGGDVPWSFGLDPSGRWLVVANENSSSLAVFRIDAASGRLTSTQQTLSVPKPVAIAFYSARN